MLKKITSGLKFYLELNSLGERKMTPNEKFEMHFVHFLFSCFPTVVLGTIVFTASPKSFEYKLYFTIGIFIFFIFYFYFVAFMSRYLTYNFSNK
jgi:lipopolysaccharide export LptBFGC system permease protein LptF